MVFWCHAGYKHDSWMYFSPKFMCFLENTCFESVETNLLGWNLWLGLKFMCCSEIFMGWNLYVLCFSHYLKKVKWQPKFRPVLNSVILTNNVCWRHQKHISCHAAATPSATWLPPCRPHGCHLICHVPTSSAMYASMSTANSLSMSSTSDVES
jgi:hypothetical protein